MVLFIMSWLGGGHGWTRGANVGRQTGLPPRSGRKGEALESCNVFFSVLIKVPLIMDSCLLVITGLNW